MRERLARLLALVTGLVLVAAALILADRRGRIEPVANLPPQSDIESIVRGRQLYLELRCSACHAVAGEGNLRAPLDGVATRLDRVALGQWVVADPAVASALPARVRAMKSDYRALSPEAFDALLDYLQSLTDPPPT